MCKVTFLSLFYFSITVSADISYFGAILLTKSTTTRPYAMKDRSQKSEILLLASLFRDLYFAAYKVHKGKRVITDRATHKCIQITIRTLADAKSRHLLSQQDLSYLGSMIVTFILQTNTMS